MNQAYNSYDRQMTQEEILSGAHRAWVGGMWEELGQLQLEFTKRQGMLPLHKFLDVGCGALRGGLKFIDYLESANYFGIDINESLIRAGQHELEQVGLSTKVPNLLVDDSFAFQRFGMSFDYAIAQSVFTHLPMNHIIRCLVNVSAVLKPTGVFFATYFEAPSPACLNPITHDPGGIVTTFDKDPFHYSNEEFAWMAQIAGLTMQPIGDWGHPRNQKMLAFKPGRSGR